VLIRLKQAAWYKERYEKCDLCVSKGLKRNKLRQHNYRSEAKQTLFQLQVAFILPRVTFDPDVCNWQLEEIAGRITYGLLNGED